MSSSCDFERDRRIGCFAVDSSGVGPGRSWFLIGVVPLGSSVPVLHMSRRKSSSPVLLICVRKVSCAEEDLRQALCHKSETTWCFTLEKPKMIPIVCHFIREDKEIGRLAFSMHATRGGNRFNMRHQSNSARDRSDITLRSGDRTRRSGLKTVNHGPHTERETLKA